MKHPWLLLVVFCYLPAFGQNLNFIHYNSNNSRLPHDVVYSVYQSSEGYLWICTDDGLVRFDGLQMKSFDKGLISRYTIAVAQDRSTLWLSTWKGGIHQVRNDSVVPVPSKVDYIMNTNRILVHEGLFIVYSFSDYLLLRLDSGVLKLSTLAGINSDNSLFVPGQPGYLRFLKKKNGQLLAYSDDAVYTVRNDSCILLDSVGWHRLYESTEGRLYGLRGYDLVELDTRMQFKREVCRISEKLIKAEHISYLYVLPTGTVGVGNEPLHGPPLHYMINPVTGRYIDLVEGVKTHSQVSTVCADKEGSVWLCTDGDGLYHIFDPRFQLLGPQVLTTNPHVTDVCYDPWQKSLLIGTRKGVFSIPYPLAPEPKATLIKNNFFSNRFFLLDDAVGLSGKGMAWVRSLEYKNGRIRELPFYEQHSTSSFRIQLGPGMEYTLYSKQHNRYYQVKENEPRPFHIADLAEDDRQRLWISYEHELFLFDWNVGWKKMPFWNGGLIYALLFEPGKGVWVGSASGLYLVSENGIITQWTEKEGLHNVHINCLYLQKNKGLWIGTQNGLYLLDRNRKLVLFKKRNGLIADDVLCFGALPDGFLAVGSSKGLTLFYPDAQQNPLEKSSLLVDEIKIDGHPTPLDQSRFEVSYNGTFEIKVSAITFLYPELLQFEYRLNPSDPWISTTNSSIIFTRLEPGNYKLALRVKKLEAGYSEPVVLDLRVLQPWWQNSYFYLLLIVLLGTTGAYIVYSRSEKQRRSLLLKKELADLKLKSLLTQLNPHFVSNSLNAIQFYILNREEQHANDYLSKFASLTRLILESSRHRFIPLKTEVEILETYLSLEKLRFENRFDYSIHIDENLYLKTWYLPGIVVQPFAENSINHGMVYLDTSAKGQLDIHFLKEGDSLLIRIDDNGIGRRRSAEIREKQSQTRLSLGGSIVGEISQTVNELPECYMDISITDKMNDKGEELGTRVEIRLKISEAVAEEEYRTRQENKPA